MAELSHKKRFAKLLAQGKEQVAYDRERHLKAQKRFREKMLSELENRQSNEWQRVREGWVPEFIPPQPAFKALDDLVNAQPVVNNDQTADFPLRLAEAIYETQQEAQACLIEQYVRQFCERCWPPRNWGEVKAQIATVSENASRREAEQQKAAEEEKAERIKKELERQANEEDRHLAEFFGMVHARILAATPAPIHTYLVEDILVAGQPAVWGGGAKVLKSSTMEDLTVAVTSATPFLGRFKVPERQSVALFSGELGEATVRESLARICKAKGVRLADLDLHLSFRVPRFDQPETLNRLEKFLAGRNVRLVIIDPLYLALGEVGLNAGNLYLMGPFFRSLATVCLRAGCTPILVHHSHKNLDVGKPMGLDDLAFAGLAEFARQWILLSRRKPYDASRPGEHSLLMSYGGSAGHSGLRAVEVSEGIPGPDLAGRHWQVSVSTIQEVEDREREAKESGKPHRTVTRDAKVEAAAVRVSEALQQLGGTPETGVRRKAFEKAVKLSGTMLKEALALLEAEGKVRIETGELVRGTKTFYPQTVYLLEPPGKGDSPGTGDQS